MSYYRVSIKRENGDRKYYYFKADTLTKARNAVTYLRVALTKEIGKVNPNSLKKVYKIQIPRIFWYALSKVDMPLKINYDE